MRVSSRATSLFRLSTITVLPQLIRVSDLTVAVVRPDVPRGKPPVLLIHGMFGGAWYWEPYQALLARHGYESYAINLRRHHDSRPVRDIGKVSVHDYVDDALEIARLLNSPIVIGHSMGGLVAQKVAEIGACCALVLLSSTPPRWIPIVTWPILWRQLKYMRPLLLNEPLVANRRDADALMFNRTPLSDRNAFFSRLVPESGRAGCEISFGVIAVDASRVTTPVLVVSGRDDHFVALRVARAIARKYRARLLTYDSFGHHIMSEPGWEGPATDVVNWMDETMSRESVVHRKAERAAHSIK